MPANVLLVEGSNDTYVTRGILKKHKLPENLITIKEKEGWQGILAKLDTELDDSELENLGILIDADKNLPARWAAVSKTLTGLGYIVPPTPDQAGTILVQSGKPRLGIWLMPDNKRAGALEDFLISLVPDPLTNALWKLSEKSVDEAIFIEPAIPRTKAWIRTYLAWKKESGAPLGKAIEYGYLDVTKLEAVQYLDWLKNLFL